MTPRRASALGASLRQQLARVRSRGPAAALVSAALLLPATTLPGETHSTHAHHASVESSGRVPAHAVHDVGTRTSHAPAKGSNGRSSASASRKREPAPKHASQSHPGATDKHSSGAHNGRKHHEQQPPDEPQPVHRANTERNTRGRHEALAEQKPTRNLSSRALLRQAPALNTFAGKHVSRRAAASHVESARIDSGRTVNEPLHTAHPHNSAVSSGTLAASDSVEATDTPLAPNTEMQRAAADAHAGAATAAVVANALSQSGPRREVVEGFGAEVDFHAPAARAAHAPAVVLPKETPAEQERDLRAAADIAGQPMFVPLYARDGQLIVPPPLKGSHDILIHQNQMADDAGLTRIQDDADLNRLRGARLLVDFPESASLHVNEGLPENRRSARPWTVKFATDIARAFYAHFGEPLQVNSAVRTVAYQLRLQRTNGNAAAADGEGASPHLTGQALDFGKRGMSVAEIAWMRSYLLPLIDAGKIDVEEEFQQACFHISVYASYAPALKVHAPAKTEVAQVTKAVHSHAASPIAAETDDNLR